MEKLPQIIERSRLPLPIEVHDYFHDHRFMGKTVLPAVEIMQALAVSTKSFTPEVELNDIREASFSKFIYISPEDKIINAFNEIEVYDNNIIASKLITTREAKNSSITRTLEHAKLYFSVKKKNLPPPPYDQMFGLEGIIFDVPLDSIYSELVPFGPFYHNIQDSLYISKKGAITHVNGGTSDAARGLLGSPFPLDAAFHAGCIWAQRFLKVVAFPVGFGRRKIYKTTQPGEKYFCKAVPVKAEPGTIFINIWINDSNGDICEAIYSLQMRDVSAGKLSPPDWILDENDNTLFKKIEDNCRDFLLPSLKQFHLKWKKFFQNRNLNGIQK